MNIEDKALAVKGLISYRYKGRYGYIMIGALDHDDAIKEANRSLSYGDATMDNLEIHNGSKYINVNVYNYDEFDVTFQNGKVSRMTRSCLNHCYLNNSNKEQVANYTQVVSAI